MTRYEGSRQPPDVEDLYSLKIDNIKYSTQPEDLERAFRKFGEIGDVYIPRDPGTQESRGFGFVRFYSKRDAEDALDAMDGREVDGREVRVAFAAAKGGRGRGRGRGRDGGFSHGGSASDRGYGSYDRSSGRAYNRDDYSRENRTRERSQSRDEGRRRSPMPRSRNYSRSPHSPKVR